MSRDELLIEWGGQRDGRHAADDAEQLKRSYMFVARMEEKSKSHLR